MTCRANCFRDAIGFHAASIMNASALLSNSVFYILTALFTCCCCLFLAEKSGKEVMSKGSTGMEVILASLKVSSYLKIIIYHASSHFNLLCSKKNISVHVIAV